MATLNELGRNSASVTYGPYATGQDLFPTLQAVDTWFRNDTWQGTAVAASTTLTGTGTLWTTQARAGDYIMVAGQQRIVAAVASDTSMTVTVAFNPAITVASAVKVISSVQPTQTSGYILDTARNDTTGVVSVTNNSSTITGVGTYFLSDATNSIALISMTGTVAISTAGVITGTSTVFQTGAPTNNSLYPGDSVAVTTTTGAVYYFEIKTVSSDTSATLQQPIPIAISGATISKATNGVVGRVIQINGRMRTITAIASNTSMTVNYPMDFTDSNLRYKTYPRGTIANASAAAGTLYGTTSATASNSTSLTIAATLTGSIIPGAVLAAPIGIGTLPAGTTIVNQQYAATGTTAANNTSVAGTNGTNVLTTSGTQTGTIVVGHLVTGNGAAVSGVPAGTYVVGITGSSPNFTITLSQNLTGTVSGQVYFAVPGGLGVYTTSNATTFSAQQIYFSSIQGTNCNWFWDLGRANLISSTNTAYMYQASLGDQVWIGDEVRTFNYSSFGGTIINTTTLTAAQTAYLTDYVGYSGNAVGVLRQNVFGVSFKRENSYINGTINRSTSAALTTFTTDLRVGDELIIDGSEVTVTQIVSDSQIKINMDMSHSAVGSILVSPSYSSGGAAGDTTFDVDSATSIAIGNMITGVGIRPDTYVTAVSSTTITINNPFLIQATGTYNFYRGTNFYKKLKLHGYSLEGTREGGVGIPTTASATTTATGSTTTLTTATSVTGTILPGMQVSPTVIAGTVLGLTYITNQLFGVSAGSAAQFTASGTIGNNFITTTVATAGTIVVGHLVCGNGAVIAGIAPSTYVTAIVGTSPNLTVYLSQPLTATVASQAVYFYVAGGLGAYTTSASTTLSAAATSLYTPLTGKFTQATTILATNGTSYPMGTQTIVVATAPTVGQYNFVKVSGAGGPPKVLSGQVTYASTFVYGTNTLFTSELHIGAELIVAGQYLTVVSIVSDTILNVAQNAGTAVVALPTPFYRSVPLYTYAVSTSTTTINLATPIKNNLYTGLANPPQVYFPSTGADFLEYVYSAPNYSAEQGTTTLLNTSLDRKYVAFRMWPLFQNTNATPTATVTIGTAVGAYATPVYERWTAGYAQTLGVGINQADLSGGTMVWGAHPTGAALNVTMPVTGSLTLQMGVQGLATGVPNPITAAATGTMGTANAIYTVTSGQNLTGPMPFVASLYGVYDITAMTQVTGGTLFLFGNKRYFALQGRSAGNSQSQWVGCLEFERAQPEDSSSGTGTTSGVTFGGTQYGGVQLAVGSNTPGITTPGFNQSIQYVAGAALYPTYAYFNGNRMPTGAQQIPTVPQLGVVSYPVHGCVLACPRVRNSASDLVGFNAHIYSALTITTGRWGHLIEFGNFGTYQPAYLGGTAVVTGNTLTVAQTTPAQSANTIPQPHMGQLVPVYTNIYNAKRFMFSPVVVLGPSYDPDIRGRLFGLKVLPSGLGTLMDTVSITVDGNYFYNTGFAASDHWVIGSPPSTSLTTAYPGQQTVVTNRFTMTANPGGITQSWRSLEDTSTQASLGTTTFTNNFRFALPA